MAGRRRRNKDDFILFRDFTERIVMNTMNNEGEGKREKLCRVLTWHHPFIVPLIFSIFVF